jgi:hypothetical protein
MGLKEKRRLQELQTELLPSLKRELHELCGTEVEWHVDWDSFGSDMEALDNIEHQGLRRIYTAFVDVCLDDLGKKCVKEFVKQISVRNVERTADKKIQFQDGTLSVSGAWGAGWEGYPQEEEIRDVLEASL